MVLLISSCYSMNIFASNDNRFDAEHQGSNYGNVHFKNVKRSTNKQCVRCKFGLMSCCEPNICVKKTLRPDKCLHIKHGK